MNKTLKITLWVSITLLLILVIGPAIMKTVYKSPSEEFVKEESGSSDLSFDSKKAKIMEILSKEQKVKDHVLTDADVLYVSVLDDGSNRSGLAEYFCQEIKMNGIKIDRVKIVKYGSLNDKNRDNAYGVLLGESWCK